MSFSLKENMLLGVASAATQIEGGDHSSNWNDWYERGFIKDGTNPATDNDHWDKWREDTALMQKMGLKIYRFGIEWARIMPREDEIDEEAIERYREELLLLREYGIRPLMTIHHFTNPMWFEKKGGFERQENLHYYLELVELAVSRFGDLCSDYVTINEPNVYATNSYFFGSWPPGEKSLKKTLAVMENLAFCHIEAYGIIHGMRREMGYDDTMVACANHLRVFAPKNPKNPWHRLCARLNSYLFQDALTHAMTLGKFRFPMKNRGRHKKGEYTDFIGLNYYTRSTVSGIGDGVRENSPRNDLDWEIYPHGIVECAESLYKVLPRPIWVTENGTCDNDDRFRCRYLYEHLREVCESSLPFERFYHWCFCDNFEWVEGNSSKFGLVSIDKESRARQVKESGEFYSAIITEGGVSEELYEKFVQGKEYDIR